MDILKFFSSVVFGSGIREPTEREFIHDKSLYDPFRGSPGATENPRLIFKVNNMPVERGPDKYFINGDIKESVFATAAYQKNYQTRKWCTAVTLDPLLNLSSQSYPVRHRGIKMRDIGSGLQVYTGNPGRIVSSSPYVTNQ